MQSDVILASTSVYRAQLLQRLGLGFRQLSPDCDETPLEDESALALVQRLAIGKADSVARNHPRSIVIGSDQVACCRDEILGKPGDHAAATAQLEILSGNTVEFHTGLCVMRADLSHSLQCVVTTSVEFKTLTHDQIERYLRKDQPYDCAASFRSEGFGSTIVNRMSSDDPTALIGLPIIRVADFLNQVGVELP